MSSNRRAWQKPRIPIPTDTPSGTAHRARSPGHKQPRAFVFGAKNGLRKASWLKAGLIALLALGLRQAAVAQDGVQTETFFHEAL